MTTRLAIPALEWQAFVDYAHQMGLRFIKSDDINASQEVAQVALTALDEKIATSGVFGDTLTDCIQARDELQAAICHAQDVS
jgi:hypothetical protein